MSRSFAMSFVFFLSKVLGDLNSKTAAEGLEPLGCISDRKNSYLFYFFFFNVLAYL